jgi:hypothetical protein
LSVAIARGQPFLGRTVIQGPVLYLPFDEGTYDVQQHFRDMEVSDSNIYIHDRGRLTDGVADALAEVIEEINPALIVADTLIHLTPFEDINNYTEVSRGLMPILDVVRSGHTHLLALHHLGKGERSGSDRVLGSTAISAAVDTTLLLDRVGESVAISSEQRRGKGLPRTILLFDAERRVFSIGDAVAESSTIAGEQRVLQALEAEGTLLKIDDLRVKVGMGLMPLQRALESLIASGRVQRSGEGRKGNPYYYDLPR